VSEKLLLKSHLRTFMLQDQPNGNIHSVLIANSLLSHSVWLPEVCSLQKSETYLLVCILSSRPPCLCLQSRTPSFGKQRERCGWEIAEHKMHRRSFLMKMDCVQLRFL